MSTARIARRASLESETSARPRFNALLRSAPVALPYAGDLGRLAVVYNQSHCMSLDDDRPTLLGALQKQLDAKVQAVADLFSTFNATWDAVIARQQKSTLSEEERLQAIVHLLINPAVAPADRLASALRYLTVEADPGPDSVQSLTPDEEAAFTAATDDLGAAIGALTTDLDRLRVQVHQAVIGWVVVAVGVQQTKKDAAGITHTTLVWPWEGPAPTPGDPASFALLDEGHADDWVQRWIATEGVAEVKAGMRTPLFGT